MAPEISDAIIRVRDISVQFGSTKVLDGLNLDVKRGEIGRARVGKECRSRCDWSSDVCSSDLMAPEISDAIIRVRDISVQFGSTKVLDGLNLDVKRGEILGFVGPSGAGKSVLTRTIIAPA